MKLKKVNISGIKDRFLSHVEKSDGCWTWTGCKNNKGYGAMAIGMRKNGSAHQISYVLFKGEIISGLCVLHKCDNPACVNPDHLFLGTHRDNARDRMLKGRGHSSRNKGIRNASAKLDYKTVNDIRLLLNSGAIGNALAKQYNVSKATISRVKNNRLWNLSV